MTVHSSAQIYVHVKFELKFAVVLQIVCFL